MRFFITGTLLCVLASTALAGEHYIEIWNPPEARSPGAHANTTAKKAQPHRGTKHKLASADRLTPRKIAEPAMRAPAPTLPVTPGAPVRTAPGNDRTPAIPPQIGPDGNILTVSYRAPLKRTQTPLRAQ
ncbi:conserved exported hypothetical protein [Paraburkholderia unamae]|uniref:hypothetical protein n=1 Tax=Paraburkholderia unamae TaxID=219649 RepID=UPI000DC57686|nr:hypothetical protein [Paraburkholderia unamae]RAR65176.1 hypothetical protein C7401_104292 [Paraburkholderia unamae]CAG9244088.1 conserved exported hypothetical protein [Paraburkholderia unamae]